jgi:hypothetical protein
VMVLLKQRGAKCQPKEKLGAALKDCMAAGN